MRVPSKNKGEKAGMELMTLRMNVYGMLVNRVPEIREKYHKVRDRQTSFWQRPAAWLYLGTLNLGWLLGGKYFRKYISSNANPAGAAGPDMRTAKRLLMDEAASSISVRETPEALAERLSAFDVVSFDVFDTLLFRPFSSPEDLFYIVGQKLDYLDFRRIRMEAEQSARERCLREKGHREITLSDIYDWLEEEAGIPKEEGMRAEEGTEEILCFANPYMLEVFRLLRRKGKRIIALSDMYLSTKVIERMLGKCGFAGMEGCFVSCEYGCSKSDGSLYGKAEQLLGPGRFIHVGDNGVSDGENARKAGWESIFYRNVNAAGMPFWCREMSPVTGSIYRGLVNAHLHNGLKRWDRDYECGFVYGGIFALGYCQFIHNYVQEHGIEKILFLARDGDVLSQVYCMLYPEEEAAGKVRYVLWSRLAAVKLAARYYKYDYFRRFLFHKVNQGFTLEQIFEAMELSDLLPGLTAHGENTLTDRNVHAVKDYLNRRWEEVLSHYDGQLETGRGYYERMLDGAAKAAVVDIGWAGSGAMALDVLINRVWRLNCEITGILAGTNTRHNAEPDMSEAQLADGKQVSYLFSQSHNRDLWERHNASKGDNVALEKLLSSPFPSFRGFTGPDWEVQAMRPRCDKEARQAERIQAGILDFCRLYLKSGADSCIASISGRDAAAPVYLWMETERRRMTKEDIQCVLA